MVEIKKRLQFDREIQHFAIDLDWKLNIFTLVSTLVASAGIEFSISKL